MRTYSSPIRFEILLQMLWQSTMMCAGIDRYLQEFVLLQNDLVLFFNVNTITKDVQVELVSLSTELESLCIWN